MKQNDSGKRKPKEKENNMFISPNNIIHQLKKVEDEIIEIRIKLKPFYEAYELLKDHEHENFNVDILEGIPAFREPWERLEKLKKELLLIHMRLAISYEKCPTSELFS